MTKIIQPYSIYPETKVRLAKLAQMASTPEHKVSASAYLDQLVAQKWYEENIRLIEADETETPPGS
jgi:hypothetical protein